MRLTPYLVRVRIQIEEFIQNVTYNLRIPSLWPRHDTIFWPKKKKKCVYFLLATLPPGCSATKSVCIPLALDY